MRSHWLFSGSVVAIRDKKQKAVPGGTNCFLSRRPGDMSTFLGADRSGQRTPLHLESEYVIESAPYSSSPLENLGSRDKRLFPTVVNAAS